MPGMQPLVQEQASHPAAPSLVREVQGAQKYGYEVHRCAECGEIIRGELAGIS